MKEILAFQQFWFFTIRSQAQSQYLFECIEYRIGIAELEIELFWVYFIQIVEIVQDRLNPLQH